MMIGATPAKFTYSGCTTPSAMPAATPASMALPPASRILKPASAARYWHAVTMWRVPMMVGRWAFMLDLLATRRAGAGMTVSLRQRVPRWQVRALRSLGLLRSRRCVDRHLGARTRDREPAVLLGPKCAPILQNAPELLALGRFL